MDNSFVDLRLNRQEGQVNESFWPSFTDIMTVIVMIFLIVMVVLLMQNMKLVAQLRTTMDAEHTASELARATGQEADILAYDLHQEEEQVAQLQLQVMRLREENTRREELINQRSMRIQALSVERDDLTQQAASLMLSRQQANRAREIAEAELAQNERSVSQLNLRLDNYRSNELQQQRRIESLVAQARQERESQTQALQQQQSVEQKYLVLADEFDDLKVRYDKLVRPARTAKGRYLVEVRYWKEAGKNEISWRANGTGSYTRISRNSLDTKLAVLKSDKPNGLYVKIIFPESSGLSYNEAWEFTNHLHKGYDYYYQESAQPSE